jgi:CRP/FNR family cyclic AMP-dependent transcriptional regulator
LVISPLLKSKAVWYGIALAMADSASSVVCSIFGYSIFLSNYPASWLIYYLVVQAFFTSLLRSVGMSFLTADPKKIGLVQYGIFTIIFIACIVLMSFKYYALPFIVAVILSGVTGLSGMLSWNLLSLSFGMREYKTVAQYANQASLISSVFASFLIPILVLFFSNLSLLVFCTLMIVSCGFFIYKLPIRQVNAPLKNIKIGTDKNAIDSPLYRYTLLFTIFTSTILAMSVYIMQTDAAHHFSHEELSSFLGYFSGVTSLIGVSVSFTSLYVLKRFGLTGLLSSVPCFSFFSSLLVIFSPTFWNVAVLGSIKNVLGYSYGTYSFEVTLNILPPALRFIAKAKIKAIANITSMLLLFVFTLGQTNIDHITRVIPFLSLVALYLAYKTKKHYKITLQKESAFKRYNILDEITLETAPLFKDIAVKSIQADDAYTILYGLDLLYRLRLTTPPKELYQLLHSPDPAIRYALIEFLIQCNNQSVLPYLITHLKIESTPKIKFKIIEGLAQLNLSLALKTVKNLSDTLFETVLSNIGLLTNPQQKNKALQSLVTLSQHPDLFVRKLIASLIGTFQINELEESLGVLIRDSVKEVRDEALRAAARGHMIALVPQITSALMESRSSYVAHFALIFLGTPTLPYLVSQVFNMAGGKSCIKTIAAIPGTEAEQSLILIIKQSSISYRDLATKYANQRACQLLVTEEFKLQAHHFAQEECAIIFHLRHALTASISPQIRVEVLLRVASAKIRFLQWIAIATRPKEINKLIFSLVHSNKSENRLIMDKAIELLELYIEDRSIRAAIAYIFEDKALDVVPLLPNNYCDSWLEQIMNTPINQNLQQSSVLSIVFELRAVRLFKDLPAEVLLALAEEVQYCSFQAGELIFSAQDAADGFYCVSQGEVDIVRHDELVTTVAQHGFFGELALLDEATRVASAVAKTPCSLIFIEKDLFNRVADDVPDVLRTVVKVILEYLRKNLEGL